MMFIMFYMRVVGVNWVLVLVRVLRLYVLLRVC